MTTDEPLAKPRVLIVHNAYQQRGGEDAVVEAEFELLRHAGHEVELYTRHNDEVRRLGPLHTAAQTVWSQRTAHDLADAVRRFNPDLVHVHNTMPLVSPSVYWAARAHGLPVVQTLHNFRLMCPQGMLLRDGQVCEACVGKLPWRAVAHRCYRGSAAGSAVLAGTVALHRTLGTYRSKVALYVALNEFCRRKFIEGGLPAERIRIKPNFIDVQLPKSAAQRCGGLYVGRLSPEKGVHLLDSTMQRLPQAGIRVVGSGEWESRLRSAHGERVLGSRKLPQIVELMASSEYLVVPSVWYENFPRTIVEAYACGLPVIASRLGALEEIVIDGVTGLLFQPGSADDLARVVQWAHEHPQEMLRMGANARDHYERRYTADKNYATLMAIYSEAIEARHAY
jgi:glycosyltransferase involved in cell wall biosynthesis